MATKNCFQVSTVLHTTPTRAVISPFASPQKPHFPTPCKAIINTSALSFSSSERLVRFRKPRLVCKAREAVDSVEAVTESSWENLVIANETPVLVEFWAPWCGPCRMIAPVINELAKEYAGKIACYKVNTDDCPNIATKYGIRSIPTVLFFNKGEKKESVIGAVPKSTLSGTIEKYTEL